MFGTFQPKKARGESISRPVADIGFNSGPKLPRGSGNGTTEIRPDDRRNRENLQRCAADGFEVVRFGSASGLSYSRQPRSSRADRAAHSLHAGAQYPPERPG